MRFSTSRGSAPFASSRLGRLLGVLWRIGLFFLAFAIASAAFIVPVASKLTAWEEEYPVGTLLYTGAAAAATLLLATWVMTRFVDRRAFRSIGFRFGHLWRDLTAGLLIGGLWIAVTVAILWALGWVSPSEPGAPGLGSITALALAGSALAVLLNVLAQQLLLCGYIFQTIESRSSFPIALLASSALFSLYHAGAFQGDWLPPVNVFLAGVLFCLAYGVTRNLWLSTAMHFAWNFVLGPVLGLTVSGSNELTAGWALLEVEGPPRFTGGAFGVEGGLAVTVTTALLVLGLALARARAPAAPSDTSS